MKIKTLPPQDVLLTLRQSPKVTTTILDPWYNRGVGGVQNDYHSWLVSVVDASASISDHVFVWGFPEVVCKVLDYIPAEFSLTAWLTWYFKNCPSVIRGWRSAQMACLHLSRLDSILHVENFLNEAQMKLLSQRKLRYIPGPLSVIETSLLVGFIGKKEQTGHPAQKPVKTIEPLVLMTTREGDIVLDPMCGSGTTGEVCFNLNRRAILCDASDEYMEMTKSRLKNLLEGK